MQVGGKSHDELTNAAKEVYNWGTVDVLYFADCLGSMDTNDVKKVGT